MNPTILPKDDNIEEEPKYINLSKDIHVVHKKKYLQLFKECTDIFSWKYEYLKTYDTSIIQHIIPLNIGTMPFR
jgi:hypothetical protein